MVAPAAKGPRPQQKQATQQTTSSPPAPQTAKTADSKASPGKPAWAPGAGQRTTTLSDAGPAADPKPMLDDGARASVHSLSDQLKGVNAQISNVQSQLQQSQTKLSADEKAVPWTESWNPFSRGTHEQKVDGDNAQIAHLKDQLQGLRTQAGKLDGQINSTISTALKNDPAFSARATQIDTLQHATSATKQFLGQIGDARNNLNTAAGQLGATIGANLVSNPNDPGQQIAQYSRDVSTNQYLSNAHDAYKTLGTHAQEWKKQLGPLGDDKTASVNPGELGVDVQSWIPMTRLMDHAFGTVMTSTENFKNAAAITDALGNVDTLHDQVTGYQDSLSSKLRTLQTSQNNQVSALRAGL